MRAGDGFVEDATEEEECVADRFGIQALALELPKQFNLRIEPGVGGIVAARLLVGS